MALNPFFQQGARSEQNLVQDLINEQLRMYGIDIHYMPRKYISEKTVIKEVVASKFDDAYPLEAYIDSFDGYSDNPVLLSKFGIEQTNDITLTISKERWETYIEPLMKNEDDIKLSTRPKEGDLIYFPLGDRLFEIKFVEHEKPFYQLMKTYVYTLKCELFRYEDEVIDTGIEEIDDTLIGENYEGVTCEDGGISTLIGPTQTLTLVGTGVSATAITGLVPYDGIRYITVTNRGGGYLGKPTVAISSAPSSGVTGIATVRMIGGIVVCNENVNKATRSVQNVDLENVGSGYTVAPKIAFIGGGGSGAAATAVIADNVIGIVTVSSGGSGFVTSPTVTFSTPKHVGAAATAILNTPMVGGGVSITSAPISIGASSYLFSGGTTGGVFYKQAPTVTFALPTGSGDTAEATATMGDYNTTGGTVASIGITTGGRFYDSAPTVTIAAPVNVGAAATVGLAGTAIDPSSVAFSTTGRAYTTAPTVAITTSTGQDAPLTLAVGIATIHPITGVVTAIGFNTTTDGWCVGTAATIGLGYTVAPTLTFSGSTAQVRATATATIDADGQVDSISIGNSGFGYFGSVPSVTITAPTAGAEQYRALGFATMRYNSIEVEGTVGIGSTVITGITTTNIIVGDRIRLVHHYTRTDEPLVNWIPTDTFVSSIGSSTLTMSAAATNAGIGTTTFEFGIDNCGIVTGIAVTFGGGGYLEPPVVSISNTVGDKDYVAQATGIHTATGISTLTSGGSVEAIHITDAGHGYVITPTVTLSDPTTDNTGNYKFNEVVTGSISGTTARVRTWNGATNVIELASVSGTWTVGEKIVGQTSGASHKLRIIDLDPTDDGFADNLEIETQADSILDFTEENPFGTP